MQVRKLQRRIRSLPPRELIARFPAARREALRTLAIMRELVVVGARAAAATRSIAASLRAFRQGYERMRTALRPPRNR